ncbi:MAG TPA: ABC transporter ATP-binding protein [Chloroflexota bacterium]|nr:ABC transporter ATP-binding protein [Chloroflexota bacterium]
MIQVSNLCKSYGPKVAISDVTFDVKPGEILGFLGPNGAGKTTTMRILCGYLPATSGTVTIAGHDVFADSLGARKSIGYLPESVPLYPEMTVKDYLLFMSQIRGVRRSERHDRVNKVMSLTHVDDVQQVQIGRISKGYRQRVGIAQALVHDPPVVVLDEPTVGLDPKQITEARQLIKSLGGSHTVLLSTHILPEVSMTCNRVVIINGGRVIAEDTPDNLIQRLRGSEQIAVQVRGPVEDVRRALLRIPNVMKVDVAPSNGTPRFLVDCAVGQDVREDLAATIVGNGWGLLELHAIGMSLEDVFLKLTTSEEDTAA